MSLKVLLNALLFQLTWFGCVLGGARGEWYWGAAGLFALLAYSFLQGSIVRDLRFVAVLVLIGFCLDSFWASSGILDYGSNASPVTVMSQQLTLAPAWITLLWAGVGLTLMHSLGFFNARPWLGALMAGGASVPSYLAGERFGAVIIPSLTTFAFVVIAWLVLFFVMFSWANLLAKSANT